MAQSQVGYDEAAAAIAAGKAIAKTLWVLIEDERQRDGFALKPSPWEGAGEYQHVAFDDDYCRLVRLPAEAARLTDIQVVSA